MSDEEKIMFEDETPCSTKGKSRRRLASEGEYREFNMFAGDSLDSNASPSRVRRGRCLWISGELGFVLL